MPQSLPPCGTANGKCHPSRQLQALPSQQTKQPPSAERKEVPLHLSYLGLAGNLGACIHFMSMTLSPPSRAPQQPPVCSLNAAPPAFQQPEPRAATPCRKSLPPGNDVTRHLGLDADMPRPGIDAPSEHTRSPLSTRGRVTPAEPYSCEQAQERALKQPPSCEGAGLVSYRNNKGTAKTPSLERAQPLWFPSSASTMAEETLKLMAWWKQLIIKGRCHAVYPVQR